MVMLRYADWLKILDIYGKNYNVLVKYTVLSPKLRSQQMAENCIFVDCRLRISDKAVYLFLSEKHPRMWVKKNGNLLQVSKIMLFLVI